MNEQEFARKLARRLDQGLDSLDQSTVNRLGAVRTRALQGYRQPHPAFGLSWASEGLHKLSHLLPHRPALWVPLLVLVLAAGSLAYWQASQSETEEVDALLLAGDLPISAYTDKDFHEWLQGSAR